MSSLKAVDVVVSKDHMIEFDLAIGDTVSWEFTTNKDIKYEVVFCSSSNNCSRTLCPLSLVNSHQTSVKGLFKCTNEPGTLVLHFDNNYSWFTNKSLHFISSVTSAVDNPDFLHMNSIVTITPSSVVPYE